jgi:phage gp36-like protein
VYCTPDDLITVGVNPLALQSIDIARQQAACVAASERADSYLRGRYPLPLNSWGRDLTIMTSYIAVYTLLAARGYAPDAGADSRISCNYHEAVGGYCDAGHMHRGWFPDVQRQAIHPDVTFNSSPPQFSLPAVYTGGPSAARVRGWTRGNRAS